ncbi:MAG: hypothetical protein ACUVRL_01130 [Candidatus Saccharicenans sp.]|uniref:hypothetical protein n=1 Tax=Candidatus Saccharicenans sp. TaxID=2819258 RepID=UPI00404A769C
MKYGGHKIRGIKHHALSIYYFRSARVRNRQVLRVPARMMERMVDRAGQLVQLLMAEKIVGDDVAQT